MKKASRRGAEVKKREERKEILTSFPLPLRLCVLRVRSSSFPAKLGFIFNKRKILYCFHYIAKRAYKDYH